MKKWDIGEFASIELTKSENTDEFSIIIRGSLKYSELIAYKIGNIEVTEADLELFKSP